MGFKGLRLVWGWFSDGLGGDFRSCGVGVWDLLLTTRLNSIYDIWVVVKIMVPFWVPIIIRPLIFRVPKKGPSF